MDPTPETIGALSQAPIYVLLFFVVLSLIAVIVWLLKLLRQSDSNEATRAVAATTLTNSLVEAMREGAKQAAVEQHEIAKEQREAAKDFRDIFSSLASGLDNLNKATGDQTTILKKIEKEQDDNKRSGSTLSNIKQDLLSMQEHFNGRLDRLEEKIDKAISSNKSLQDDIRAILGRSA